MIKLVLVDAFVIAITGYFTTLAVEQRISVDVRQDPVNVALISGLANCVSGVFHGLPAMGSVSLSAYLAGNNVKTRIVPTTSILIVLLLFYLLPEIIQWLPKSVLGVIIIVHELRALRNFKIMMEIWNYRKIDAVVWFLSFLLTESGSKEFIPEFTL